MSGALRDSLGLPVALGVSCPGPRFLWAHFLPPGGGSIGIPDKKFGILGNKPSILSISCNKRSILSNKLGIISNKLGIFVHAIIVHAIIVHATIVRQTLLLYTYNTIRLLQGIKGIQKYFRVLKG